jgi:hypothetical protein
MIHCSTRYTVRLLALVSSSVCTILQKYIRLCWFTQLHHTVLTLCITHTQVLLYLHVHDASLRAALTLQHAHWRWGLLSIVSTVYSSSCMSILLRRTTPYTTCSGTWNVCEHVKLIRCMHIRTLLLYRLVLLYEQSDSKRTASQALTSSCLTWRQPTAHCFGQRQQRQLAQWRVLHDTTATTRHSNHWQFSSAMLKSC